MKKNNIIQVLRGLAIILVLIRHAIAQVNQNNFLYYIEQIIICIHMPVFFLIAGYLYQKKYYKYEKNGNKIFIIEKIKRLILPYIFWSLVLWAGIQTAYLIGGNIKGILLKNNFPSMKFTTLIYGLITYQTYYTEHLWFLYALFIIFIINKLLGKYGKGLISIIVAASISLISNFIFLPYIVNKVATWFLFFTIGRYIANNKELKNKICDFSLTKKYMILALFVLIIILRLTILHKVGVIYKIINITLKLLIGIIGPYIIYLIAKKISSRLQAIISKIGNYSYSIYLIHNPYFVALPCIILNKILKIPAILTIVIALFLGIIMPIMVCKIIKKLKLRKISLIALGENL